MRKLIFTVGLTMITLMGCSHVPSATGVLAPNCGKTAVDESDLAAFGFRPVYGKIVVLRIFATWCPFCKADLSRMGELFANGTWNPDDIQIFLLAYHNRSEDRDSVAEFERSGLAAHGLPQSGVQLVYVDQSYAELLKRKTASGQTLFTGWAGVPFAMVFGKDGRLAFRGHFTMSDQYQENHYKFISGLTGETCARQP